MRSASAYATHRVAHTKKKFTDGEEFGAAQGSGFQRFDEVEVKAIPSSVRRSNRRHLASEEGVSLI